MGISPSYVGYTAPLWTVQLIPDSGIVNVAGLLVGNFSLLLKNVDTGVKTTGAGTFSNIQAAVTTTISGQTVVVSPASVQYQVALGDLVVGKYELWVLVTFSTGTQPFYLGGWEVLTL